jgi:hypothetical protein
MIGRAPRHAAALALVGWYLMVPPWNGPDSFDEKAPFNTWEQIDVYDSATDCSRYRVKDIEIISKSSGLLPLRSDVGRDAKSVRNRLVASRCIASDDPRLKEK